MPANATGQIEGPFYTGQANAVTITRGLRVVNGLQAAQGGVPLLTLATNVQIGDGIAEMDFESTTANGTVRDINADGTHVGVAAVAIAAGDPIYTAAGGKVTNVTATGLFLIGKAITAATGNNSLVQFKRQTVPVAQP
jgi:hypothetical protein